MTGKKKVPHVKTGKAEVGIQLPGNTVIITILLRPPLAKKLGFRIATPKSKNQKKKRRLLGQTHVLLGQKGFLRQSNCYLPIANCYLPYLCVLCDLCGKRF